MQISHQSIHPPTYHLLSIYPFIHTSILTIDPSTHPSPHLQPICVSSIYHLLPIYPSIHHLLSIYPPIYNLSSVIIYPSIHLYHLLKHLSSTHLSIHLQLIYVSSIYHLLPILPSIYLPIYITFIYSSSMWLIFCTESSYNRGGVSRFPSSSMVRLPFPRAY